MPDISMCQGITSDNIVCDKRETCYRHTAIPSKYRQSYFMFAPLVLEVKDKITQTCSYFWKDKYENQ